MATNVNKIKTIEGEASSFQPIFGIGKGHSQEIIRRGLLGPDVAWRIFECVLTESKKADRALALKNLTLVNKKWRSLIYDKSFQGCYEWVRDSRRWPNKLDHYAKALKSCLEDKPTDFKQHVLYLMAIANAYQEKKEWIKAVAVYECGLAICYDKPKNTTFSPEVATRLRDRIHRQIYRCESQLVHSIPNAQVNALKRCRPRSKVGESISNKLSKDALADFTTYRDQLYQIRTQAQLELAELNKNNQSQSSYVSNHSTIEKIYKNIGEALRKLVATMVNDMQQVLGKPSFSYEVVALGSLARDEATPYSDLEFMILINEDSDANRIYCRNLTKLLQIKVLQLGETAVKIANIEPLDFLFDYAKSPTPNGFSLDGQISDGCKTPLGNIHLVKSGQVKQKKAYELIGTPTQLATFYDDAEKKDRHFLTLLLNVKLIKTFRPINAKQRDLLAEYKNILRGKMKADENRKKRCIQIFDESLDRFMPKFGVYDSDIGHHYHVKYDLYRLPQLILQHLCLYYKKPFQALFTAIETLFGCTGKFKNQAGAADLKNIWADILELRLTLYFHHDTQIDQLKLSGRKTTNSTKQDVFYIDEKKIKTIYRVLIPFYLAAKNFADTTLLTDSRVEGFKSGEFANRQQQLCDAIYYAGCHKEAKAKKCFKAVGKNKANLDRYHRRFYDLYRGRFHLNYTHLEKAVQHFKSACDACKHLDAKVSLELSLNRAYYCYALTLADLKGNKDKIDTLYKQVQPVFGKRVFGNVSPYVRKIHFLFGEIHLLRLKQGNSKDSDVVPKLMTVEKVAQSTRTHLQNCYKNQGEYTQVRFMLGGSAPISECWINLVLSNTQQNQHMASLQTSSSTQQSASHITQTAAKQTISLEELFIQKEENGDITHLKKVLVTGGGGMGKTTTCRQILHRWGSGELWPHFELVIWIRLSHLNTDLALRRFNNAIKEDNNALSAMLKTVVIAEEYHSALPPNLLAQYIRNHYDKVLFLFDGLDELNAQTSLGEFVSQELMQHPKVNALFTARPHYHVSIIHDREVLNLGFLSEDVPKYIARRYMHDSQLTKVFTLKVKNTQYLQTLAKIPLYLEILCSLWQDPKQRDNTFKTSTAMFEALVDALWSRLDCKQTPPDPHERGKLTREQKVWKQEAKRFLHQLAFIGVQKQQKQFGGTDLRTAAKKAGRKFAAEQDLDDLVEYLVKSGFLCTNDSKQLPLQSRRYYFLHPTLQEFLTAQYLAVRFEHNDNVHAIEKNYKVKNFLGQFKYHPHYALVWIFTAGILRAAPNVLQIFFRFLTKKPRDLLGLYEAHLFIGCLGESSLLRDAKKSKDLLAKQIEEWISIGIARGDANILNYLFNQLLTYPSVFKHVKAWIKLKNWLRHTPKQSCDISVVLDIITQCLNAQPNLVTPEIVDALLPHLSFQNQDVKNTVLKLIQRCIESQANLNTLKIANQVLCRLGEATFSNDTALAILRNGKTQSDSTMNITNILSERLKKLLDKLDDSNCPGYEASWALSKAYAIIEKEKTLISLKLVKAALCFLEDSRSQGAAITILLACFKARPDFVSAKFIEDELDRLSKLKKLYRFEIFKEILHGYSFNTDQHRSIADAIFACIKQTKERLSRIGANASFIQEELDECSKKSIKLSKLINYSPNHFSWTDRNTIIDNAIMDYIKQKIEPLSRTGAKASAIYGTHFTAYMMTAALGVIYTCIDVKPKLITLKVVETALFWIYSSPNRYIFYAPTSLLAKSLTCSTLKISPTIMQKILSILLLTMCRFYYIPSEGMETVLELLKKCFESQPELFGLEFIINNAQQLKAIGMPKAVEILDVLFKAQPNLAISNTIEQARKNFSSSEKARQEEALFIVEACIRIKPKLAGIDDIIDWLYSIFSHKNYSSQLNLHSVMQACVDSKHIIANKSLIKKLRVLLYNYRKTHGDNFLGMVLKIIQIKAQKQPELATEIVNKHFNLLKTDHKNAGFYTLKTIEVFIQANPNLISNNLISETLKYLPHSDRNIRVLALKVITVCLQSQSNLASQKVMDSLLDKLNKERYYYCSHNRNMNMHDKLQSTLRACFQANSNLINRKNFKLLFSCYNYKLNQGDINSIDLLNTIALCININSDLANEAIIDKLLSSLKSKKLDTASTNVTLKMIQTCTKQLGSLVAQKVITTLITHFKDKVRDANAFIGHSAKLALKIIQTCLNSQQNLANMENIKTLAGWFNERNLYCPTYLIRDTISICIRLNPSLLFSIFSDESNALTQPMRAVVQASTPTLLLYYLSAQSLNVQFYPVIWEVLLRSRSAYCEAPIKKLITKSIVSPAIPGENSKKTHKNKASAGTAVVSQVRLISDTERYRYLASFYDITDQFELAKKASLKYISLQKSILSESEIPSVWYHNCAHYYACLGDAEKAEKNFKIGTQVEKTSSIYAAYANFLYYQKKYSHALGILKKTMLHNKNEKLYFSRSAKKLLIEALHPILERDGALIITVKILAYALYIACYSKLNQPQNAKLYLEELQKVPDKNSEPDEKEIYYRLLAHALSTLGDTQAAEVASKAAESCVQRVQLFSNHSGIFQVSPHISNSQAQTSTSFASKTEKISGQEHVNDSKPELLGQDILKLECTKKDNHRKKHTSSDTNDSNIRSSLSTNAKTIWQSSHQILKTAKEAIRTASKQGSCTVDDVIVKFREIAGNEISDAAIKKQFYQLYVKTSGESSSSNSSSSSTSSNIRTYDEKSLGLYMRHIAYVTKLRVKILDSDNKSNNKVESSSEFFPSP